jgi:amidase
MHITDLDGQALSAAIHARQISCREVMLAYLTRIQRLNPVFNAIVNLARDEVLLAQADAHDKLLAQGASLGWMHGFPLAVKDIAHALGFPTTQGSRLLAQFQPKTDSVHVARMKAAGAIVIAKTNVPEFGLGSHTFNALFGATRNAWDLNVSAGGSSGGAAVCLAQRMLPLADGSDFMGSLRNPAGWNHVFGLRPSQGFVPAWPKPELWVSQLGSDGPMARTAQDLARLLAVQAGRDARAPLSSSQGVAGLVPALDSSARGLRVGWLGDLGGHLAMERGVLDVCQQALSRLEGGGAIVEPAKPGFDPEPVSAVLGADDAGRAARRALVKPEALWEYEQAQGLSFAEFMRASVTRGEFYAQLCAHFERYDVLALPTAQCWPFALNETWPRQLGGRSMDSYHRWMEVTLYATFAGLPAISLPAGFDASGRWPMGLQLIAPPQGDAALLRVAQAYENVGGELLARRPPLPAGMLGG